MATGRKYWKLKEETLDRILGRNHFGRGYGPPRLRGDDGDDEDDVTSQGHRSLPLCYKIDVSSLRVRLTK
jgi:hypothetical protein